MYELFRESYLKNNSFLTDKLLYVGDAAGRPATKERKKDHSDADIKFAMNINAEFQTPEQYFLENERKGGGSSEIPPPIPIHPFDLFDGQIDQSRDFPIIKESKNQEIVMIVGLPCSGKTTIATQLFPSYYSMELDKAKSTLYNQINNEFVPMLNQNKSIILDGCNASLFERKYFLQKRNKIAFKCIFVDCPLEVAMHLDAIRAHLTNSQKRQDWDGFMQKFSKPSIKEGFDNVIKIPFQYNGKNQELFKLFLI